MDLEPQISASCCVWVANFPGVVGFEFVWSDTIRRVRDFFSFFCIGSSPVSTGLDIRMHLPNFRSWPLRWILPGVHFVLYLVLASLSGWSPFVDPNASAGPDPVTPMGLRLAFAINIPAWVLSNGVTAWLGPESSVDHVVLVGALLLPQWWIVGYCAEKRVSSQSQPGIMGFFWGVLSLLSIALIILVGYATLIDEAAIPIETTLGTVLWLSSIFAFSARRFQVARRVPTSWIVR